MEQNLTTRERLYFLQRTLNELKRFQKQVDGEYSKACVKCMKLIVKLLNTEIYHSEIQMVNRLGEAGKLTPKEMVHRKAVIKKRFPRRIDRK